HLPGMVAGAWFAPINNGSIFPLPGAHFGDCVVSGQVEVEWGDGDIAFAEAGNIGLGPLQMEGGIVGHPVIGSSAGILPALKALAIAAQSHGNDANAPRLAPR